jgi:uncharacterized protein YaeQ
MALSSTVYNFDVELSDTDRGVYESLSIRAARHPSETAEYFLTRVLAYCLEYTEGIVFTAGLAEPDTPAIEVRDLTGSLRAWIDVGAPNADRLHKASKAAPRVAVYTHKDAALLLRQLAGERIHRAESIELYAVDRALLAELTERLERRMKLSINVSGGHLYVTVGDEVLSGEIERLSLG